MQSAHVPGTAPRKAVWPLSQTSCPGIAGYGEQKKKQQEMELKTCALLAAFILVNTLSDCNAPGSCLSQPGSGAHPSEIPIEMLR